MPAETVSAVRLACHPETPTDAVRGIAARVSRERAGELAVSYLFEGDLRRVRVPAPRAPRPASRLWEHTCCEIFIAGAGGPAYHEFNFSPSGEWAVYAFDGYRSLRAGGPRATAPPRVKVHGDASTLELDAVIGLEGLEALSAGARLQIALAAVVEDERGALSYWALKHLPGRPDFHRAEAFALELAESRR